MATMVTSRFPQLAVVCKEGADLQPLINYCPSRWEVFGAAPNTSFTEQPLATTHQVLGEYTFLASNQWFLEGRRPVSIFHRKSFKEIQ